MNQVNQQDRWWLMAMLLVVGTLVYLLSPILMPFVASALLAYLGDPLVDRLEERRVPRGLAVSLVFLVMLLFVFAMLLVLVPRVEAQLSHLFDKIPGYIVWLKSELLPRLNAYLSTSTDFASIAVIQESLSTHWTKAGGVFKFLLTSVSNSGLAIVGWLANLVLIPVLTFYLLRDWDDMIAGIKALFPASSAKTWISFFQESDEVLGAFLRGQMLVMLALGVIYTTGLWMIGLDLALLIGMFAGMLSFVPYLGLIVGILIAGVAAVLQFKGFGPIPLVVLVFVVGQLIEGMFLTPKLVGERVGLHPVAVIFAVMAGGQLYGFFGILLALPVAAVVMVLLRHLLDNYRRSSFFANS